MAIAFSCECGKQLQAADEHAGQRTRCPGCGRELTIPNPRQAVQPTASAPPPSSRPAPASRFEPEPDHPRPQGTSGKAVASLILGIASLGLCLWLPAAIPAFIFGILGLRDISRSRGRLRGQGLAITGMVVGGLATVFCPVFSFLVLVPLVLPAVQKVREAASRQQSQSNLRMMGLAAYNYHTAVGVMPMATSSAQEPGRPHPYSWRVALLPYLEQQNLQMQYNFNEPWDSPNNRRLLSQMPRIYAHPLAPPEEIAAGSTRYRAFGGPLTALGADGRRGARLTGITDGTSNTIMIVEAADAVPWTKPDEFIYDPNTPLPPMGGLFAGGFNVLMADGSVLFIRKDFNERIFRAALTRSGGEAINVYDLRDR